MSDLKENNEESQNLKEGKQIAFYSNLLSAWIETRMLRDKTLVTLSAAAIGLLVTILTTAGVTYIWEVIFYFVSFICFLITIYSSLTIYQLNSKHLEKVLKGSSSDDPILEKYDKRSFYSFIIGTIFAILIGISSAYLQIRIPEESLMSEKKKLTENLKNVKVNESLSGVGNLNPRNKTDKSLSGIENLNPQNTQQSGQSQSQSNQSNSSGNNDSGQKK